MTEEVDFVQDVADILVEARRTGTQAKAAALDVGIASIEKAYAVQDRVASMLNWFGEVAPTYWKSGGPGKEKAILHAALPPDGVLASPGDASDLLLFAPGIEAEIALRLGRDVTPNISDQLTYANIDDLIDSMTVAIEVVDSRWFEGPDAPAMLRLADQQSHGALVLGEWQPYARRNWAAQTCRIRIGTQEDQVRQGTHAYGDPTWAVPEWLRHATRKGATVAAGTVVTTGTWCGILPVERGERIVVEFERLGEVAIRV